MTRKRALTVGSATLDMFIQGPNSEDVHSIAYPEPSIVIAEGRKIDVQDIHVTFGGGALNAAAAFHRQGWEAAPCFVRGNDNTGLSIIEKLSEYGLPTQYHTVLPEHKTGISTIIPSPRGNASLLVYRGANSFLTMHHIPQEILGEVDLLFCGPLAGGSASLLPELTKRMRPVCPLIASGLNRYQAHEWLQLRNALKYIDLLCCNEREARTLCERFIQDRFIQPRRQPPELHRHSGFTEAPLPQLLQPWIRYQHREYYLLDYVHAILQQGVSIVSITNGAEGAYIITPEYVFFQAIQQVPILNTVGAGDAFAATLSASLAEGNTIPEALRSSLLNVVGVLHGIDAHTSLLTREELSSSYYAHCIEPLQQFSYQLS